VKRFVQNKTHTGACRGVSVRRAAESKKSALRRAPGAFSLVELLVVVALIVLLMGLAVPAINGLAGSGGRAGAVNVLMNTLEQARVAALETSTNVYVVFADKTHPDVEKAYRALIVLRDYDPALDPTLPVTTKFVALTKWQFLPKGILFFDKATATVFRPGASVDLDLDGARDAFLFKGSGPTTLPHVKFSSSGIVEQPSDSQNLKFFICEGFYDEKDKVIRFSDRSGAQSSTAALFEQISLSRYTGRAQLDVSTLPASP
jgi:type II secretory pathway pseudopilin PulG